MQTQVWALIIAGLMTACSTKPTSPRATPSDASANTAGTPRPPPPRPAALTTGTSTIAGRFVVSVAIEPYETFVDVRPLGDRRPHWHWRPTSKHLSLRWHSDRPPGAQRDLLRQMLTYLVQDRGLELASTTLRAELSPWHYPAYAERLARFAAEDRRWPAAHTRGASLHRYILETTQGQPLHPELDDIFAPWGHKPRLDGVEKCLQSGVRIDKTTRQWLRGRGLTTRPSLPLGCLMAHFVVEPIPRAHYLANAGVMVAMGQTKVLFDPFFRNTFRVYEPVPESIERALMAGTAPFDGIDALFVSHHHGDHFSPEVVAAYLRAQPDVVLVAPGQAVDAILDAGPPDDLKSRMRAVRLAVGQAPARLTLGRIDVEAVRIPHAGGRRVQAVENIAYRVRLEDRAIVVHLGDADPNRQHFDRHRDHWVRGLRPSVAFPPYWFFAAADGRAVIAEHLRAEQTIGVHVPAEVPDVRAQRAPELRAYDLFTQPGETRDIHIHPAEPAR